MDTVIVEQKGKYYVVNIVDEKSDDVYAISDSEEPSHRIATQQDINLWGTAYKKGYEEGYGKKMEMRGTPTINEKGEEVNK